MSLLTKLERLLGRFAIPNLSLYLVIGQVLFWGLALMAGFDIERIALLPAAVLAGEVWRLVTFLFLPAQRPSGVHRLRLVHLLPHGHGAGALLGRFPLQRLHRRSAGC